TGALALTETQYDSQLVSTDPKYTATADDSAPGKVLWCRVSASSEQGTVYAYAEAPVGVTQPGGAGAAVPATLSLTMGAPPTFAAFAPGVPGDYRGTPAGRGLSTAADATLSVADPSAAATGHLTNGSFSLPQALQANAGGGFAAVGGSSAPTVL